MYAKSTRPSAKREVQEDRSAKHDDLIAYIRNVTHINIFFNLKRKLSSFKDNKSK